MHESLRKARKMPVPHELAIAGIYFPPLLVASMIGVVAGLFTSRLLTRFRLARHFYNPPLVLLALIIIYTTVLGAFIIGI